MAPPVTFPCTSKEVPTLDKYGVPLSMSDNSLYIEMKEALEEMLVTEEAVKDWLHSPGAGSTITPVEYIVEGNMEEARRAVFALEYGIPS